METNKLKKYETDYAELPFENILREYRQQNIISSLQKGPNKKILEIGCGFHPLFKEFHAFEKMVIVEPGETYYNGAKSLAAGDPRISVIHGFFENVVDELAPVDFDFIIIGGFLHEINNPSDILNAVKKVCTPATVVHSFVPNANSFHRLVASEMGLIKDVYEKSGHDKLFQRVVVYNTETFRQLFFDNSFSVEVIGTYFIKPFAHTQMNQMVEDKIIDRAVLDGLNKMTKYFPEHGAEIFINSSCTP
jgi:SAM-dependent methyltransferase